jgi:PAS domain S-box-containing protein
VVLLAANVALTFRNTRQLNEDARWVAHTHEVIAGCENVLALANDAEAGQRGFLITGEPRYLEPYQATIPALGQAVDRLEGLTADNPRQQVRFPALRQRIAARLREIDRTVALRRQPGGFEPARQALLAGRGQQETSALRAAIGEMIESEQTLLRQRSRQSGRAYQVAVLAGFLSGLAALAAFLALLALLRRYLAARGRATAVIAEQAERLRTTLASIGDAVITTDLEGSITNLNAVAESLTGWTRGEALGQPLEAVFRIVNEETRRPVANPVTRALADGVVVGLANHTILLAKDGTEWPVDDSAAPIRCKDGEVVGCVLVFRDVSEGKQAEAAVLQSAERERLLLAEAATANAKFRAFFEQGPLFAGIMDLDGTILEPNRLSLEACGYTREQVVGKPFWKCPWWNRSPALMEQIKAASAQAARGETFQAELPYFVADGSERRVDLVILPIKDEAGRILFLAPTGTDITRRRQLEDHLRQMAADLSDADRRKDEFLATLAHELRNPLAPIRNGLQILKLAGPGGPVAEQARSIMERQLGQMVRLVDDLLDVSRITRNNLQLRKERVDLAAVLASAVETSRPLIEANAHQLTVSLPTQPIHLDADLTRLAQVFSNLLNNAAKYTEKGGCIRLSAVRQGGEAVVTVADTGVGIPFAMLPKVFDMFTQVDRTLERSQGGLGIGLTLVRQLVHMHGGTVQAFSEGAGQGSELVVRLPVVLTTEDLAAAPPSPR